MSEPFIGQITMFGFDFAPRGWATCDGQLLSIAQYTAVFSLLGTAYGGDGRTTFGLPDLRSRFPTHQGQGPGLSRRTMGQAGGEERVTLLETQMPTHNHTTNNNLSASSTLKASTSLGGDTSDPGGNSLGNTQSIYKSAAPGTSMQSGSVETSISGSVAVNNAGGSQSHDNMPPYQVVNFCIALQGLFPPRS